jgi:cobyrinic acid a,c-diamide synthase
VSPPVPGLVIAATASGCGKTLVTLALLRQCRRAGLSVASAKVGPDYIDPAFHAVASARPCLNLDPWAMRPSTINATLATLAEDSALIVCEGVMGLFDGATATTGSTADIAAATGWPVILVIDARAQAASAAAVILGFARYRSDAHIAGVVFNRIGGDGHLAVLTEAVSRTTPEIAVLGGLPRDDDLRLPERHLGLVQAAEHADLNGFLDRAAAFLARHLAVDRLIALAKPARQRNERASPAPPPLPPLGQRIAIADDEAFAFRYPAVIAGWRAAGAEIMPFSPLADQPPDPAADGIYLPGGYPELHAGRLAGNQRFLDGLKHAAQRGAAVFGECGGYMALGEGLIDSDGVRHKMAGLLPLETSFAARRLHLGYRTAMLATDCPLGRAGKRFRGHEFHYATVMREGPAPPLFTIGDAAARPLGATGLAIGSVSGSFVHLIDSEE